MSTSQATPVLGHGTNNLDSGFDLSDAAESKVFLDLAGTMYGDEIDDEVDEVEVEDEEYEDESDEDESDEVENDEEEDDTEEAEESDEEGNETEESDTEEFYVVKIDGEELEVSEDELLSGYQRQRDYTRKTQELSDKRKSVETYLNQLEAERLKYETALTDLVKSDEEQLKKYDSVDWDNLKKTDPNQFLLLKFEYQEAFNSIQAKKQAREEIVQQRLAEKDLTNSQRLSQEEARVAELVEGWIGETNKEVKETLRAQTIAEGFTEADEDLLSNAMVLKLLQKANKYDNLLKAKEQVVEKKVKRKVPKVVKSGNRSNPVESKKTKQYADSLKRLKQTGDIKDSVSVFANFV